MRNAIKSELWKSFNNIWFHMALVIGLSIVLIDVVENHQIVAELGEATKQSYLNGSLSGSHEGFSLFILSLPYNGINYATRLYLFIWPIIAAMPYGWAYSMERRNGLYNQLVARSNVHKYFFSKYIAVFLSGGFVVSFPVLVDILANALICPYEVVDVTSSIASIFNGWFLSELYFTHPWAHSLIWCVVLFFVGGSTGGLCLIFGTKLRLQVLVTLIPFVILTLWDVIYWNVIVPFVPNTQPIALLSPLQMVIAANVVPNPAWAMFLLIGILSITGTVGGYWQVIKHELV